MKIKYMTGTCITCLILDSHNPLVAGEHCTVSVTRYPALTLSFSALVLLLVFSCVILGTTTRL